jgi:hypothetical protein
MNLGKKAVILADNGFLNRLEKRGRAFHAPC